MTKTNVKISQITIRNFRSIDDITIGGPLNDVWTLVGQNNAGKSAVFSAIRIFYGDEKVTSDDFNKLTDDGKPIEIIIEYLLEDEKEIEDLPKYYLLPGNRLKVIKRFTKENLKGEGHGYEFVKGEEIEREEEFFGARNVQIGKLGSVIFIPAVKALSDELKSNNYALFRKLIGRVVTEALESLESYRDIERDTKRFIDDVKSPGKRSAENEFNSIDEIQEALDETLSSWQLKTNIQINIPSPQEIIVGGADLRFINTITNLEENPMLMGSGAQRSIVNSLVLLWARIERQRAKSDKKNFHGELSLLLYEEPEALLHYDQERKLLRTLEEIAKSENNQVFICTHSPNLISKKFNALESLIRFVKVDGLTNIFKAENDYLQQLKDKVDSWDFVLWLNPDRNTMFFVDRVIFVEGPGDKAFLNYLINENNFDKNLYVVDCGAKEGLPLFIKLAEQFGIPHLVMFDKDREKDERHKTLNKAVIDSKNQFTVEILSFVDRLEAYIGFDLKTDTHNKPLQILTQLKEGKLSKEQEKEFLEFLQK